MGNTFLFPDGFFPTDANALTMGYNECSVGSSLRTGKLDCILFNPFGIKKSPIPGDDIHY